MKRHYIKPLFSFSIIEEDYIILGSCSGGCDDYHHHEPSSCGCTCGCVTRDNPKNNYGCWGCPHCSDGPHFNSHACGYCE